MFWILFFVMAIVAVHYARKARTLETMLRRQQAGQIDWADYHAEKRRYRIR